MIWLLLLSRLLALALATLAATYVVLLVDRAIRHLVTCTLFIALSWHVHDVHFDGIVQRLGHEFRVAMVGLVVLI